MKTRIALTVTAIAAGALAATAVFAQQDPVAARKALMKGNVRNALALVQMMRGQQPYDQGKVDAAIVDWTTAAQKLPELFPANSKTGPVDGSDYFASPKVWEAKADFDAHAAKFGKEAAELKTKIKDVDSLKATFPVFAKSCDSCHETYRVKKG